MMAVLYTGVDQHGIIHEQCELPFGRAEIVEFVTSCLNAGWHQVSVWEGMHMLAGLRNRHTWFSVVVPNVEAVAP